LLGITVTVGVTYTDIDDRTDILHFRNLEIQALQLATSEKKSDITDSPGEVTVDAIEKCDGKNEVIGCVRNKNDAKEKEIQYRKIEIIDKTEHSNGVEKSCEDSGLSPELLAYYNNCPKTRFFFQQLLNDKSFHISVPL
jgi:hypothetical protein